MLRFLADENFNGDILRGLRLRRPDVDLLRVQDAGLEQAEDPAVLAWAAERATMSDFAYRRVSAAVRSCVMLAA